MQSRTAMHVIAFLNTKGGVGKTTLCANIATRAAQDSRRVAIVDLDPQGSIRGWWQRGGRKDNPTIFEGADSASEAIEALALDGWDWVFIDGPPAFVEVLRDAIEVADLTVIPVRASLVDILAAEDAVVLVREAGAEHLVVLNDVHHADRKLSASARTSLFNAGLPIAATEIRHRQSYIASLTVGRAAHQINNGKDTEAKREIDDLWGEIKSRVLAEKARHSEGAAHEHQ